MSNDAWDEEAMRLIHEASELIKPGEGEAVFYIRVGGPHTQCTVKAAAGVDPAKVIHAAIDVLNKEFADLKNCPVHTPQPSELVERLRADAVAYHASMYEPETDDMFTLAYQWQDKKHRHVNDLCGKLNEAADHITQLEAQLAKLQVFADEQLKVDSEIQAHQQQQIAKLQARLEVVPGWSEDADGIACRNDTIKLQDECIAKLQADGDKLAGAATALRDDMLMRAEMRKRRNNGELVVEAGNGVWRRINAALTEWKDRA